MVVALTGTYAEIMRFARIPSRACTISTEMTTYEIWRFYFAFALAFVMERQINIPSLSFAFALIVIMLGRHKPLQQVTLMK